MKFKINRLQLLESLHKIQPVITKSTHNPLLSSVLIRINEGVMTLVGTDLGITVVDSFAIDTNAQLDMCIDFDTLNRWTENTYRLNEEWIDVAQTKSGIELRHAGSEIEITSSGTSGDFPKLDETKTELPIATTNGLELANAIRRAMQIVNPRIIQNITLEVGVLLFRDEAVSVLASDGVCLAYNRVKADIERKCEIAITHKVMRILDGMLTKIGSLKVSQIGTQILFRCGDTSVYSTTTESNFPVEVARLESLKSHKNKAVISGDLITKTLLSFAGLIDQDHTKRKGIYVIFSPETNQIIVQPEDLSGGKGRRELDARSIEGDAVRFVANYNVWNNCVRSIEGIDIVVSYDEGQWVHLTNLSGSQKCIIAPLHPR